MTCPNCQNTLEKKDYRGIPADTCTQCQGIWLDIEELDKLEDQTMSDDQLKSSVMLEHSPSEKKCPHCQSQLRGFQYRMYQDLHLEFCPNKHGWYLDQGEGEKVLELMEREEQDVNKIKKIEDEWIGDLWRLKNPSFINKLTDLFS